MKVAEVCFVLFLCILGTQAFEVCHYNNGTAEYCPDRGTSIGYCCETWYTTLCCYYTPVWSLWYFWTPLVLFIFFVTLCACACRLCASCRSSSSTTSSVHHTIPPPMANNFDLERQAVITSTTGVAYQTNGSQVHVGPDNPPSYADIQQSQAITIASYQEKSDPSLGNPPASRKSSSSSSEDC